jgi:hypothetical protein
MGKPPFSPTKSADKASAYGSPQQQTQIRPQGTPSHAPLPPQLSQKPPPLNLGSTERVSPQQGMRQADGLRSGLSQNPPQKQAPLQARHPAPSSGDHQRSGIERAMSEQADRLHPLKSKR